MKVHATTTQRNNIAEITFRTFFFPADEQYKHWQPIRIHLTWKSLSFYSGRWYCTVNVIFLELNSPWSPFTFIIWKNIVRTSYHLLCSTEKWKSYWNDIRTRKLRYNFHFGWSIPVKQALQHTYDAIWARLEFLSMLNTEVSVIFLIHGSTESI